MPARTIFGFTKKSALFILFCGLLASACGQTPAGTLATELREITIHLPQSLTPLRSALTACGREANVLLVAAGSADLEEADLVFALGDPSAPSDFLALIAWESISVIVSADTPHDAITPSDIKKLFSGQIRTWAELGGDEQPVQVWVLPAESDVRIAFDRLVLENSNSTPGAGVVPNAEAMLETIQTEPGAIGYLPNAQATEDVEVIETGVQLPVLATTTQEPEGPARDLLLCLQSESGQEMLARFYTPLDEE